MRWFFLLFIVLVAVFGNVAMLEKFSALRLLGAGSVNLFVVALFMTWWFAYFSSGPAKVRG